MNRWSTRYLVMVAVVGALLGMKAPATGPVSLPVGLPASEAGAKAVLEASPRHGEWAEVKVGDRTVRCWVVYPEVKDKAGVVVLIHEIYGLSDWMRAVADQVAAEGFIAVAPDFLSGKGPEDKGTEGFASRDEIVRGVRSVGPDEVVAVLSAVRDHAKSIPAANGKVATMGFCWGGSRSFEYAVAEPALDAAVVYYGSNPADAEKLARVRAPVLGLYGADDARVNTTVGPASEIMKAANKSYTARTYEGAGHGFLRQQEGRDGANLKAANAAWAETVSFLKKHLK